MVFSNAGFGDYKAFEDSDFSYKKAFFDVNLKAHVMLADYFCKAFLAKPA